MHDAEAHRQYRRHAEEADTPYLAKLRKYNHRWQTLPRLIMRMP